jgi:hypothetical protein
LDDFCIDLSANGPGCTAALDARQRATSVFDSAHHHVSQALADILNRRQMDALAFQLME